MRFRILPTIVFLVLSYSIALAQPDTLTLKKFKSGCFRRVITVELPVTFQEKISTYTDGTFYTYAAPDGETLVIHCGYDYQLPFLNETQFKVLGKSKSGRYGIVKRTKTYWREENFDNGLTIYYSNIHESNKQFFDKLIEGIIKTLNK